MRRASNGWIRLMEPYLLISRDCSPGLFCTASSLSPLSPMARYGNRSKRPRSCIVFCRGLSRGAKGGVREGGSTKLGEAERDFQACNTALFGVRRAFLFMSLAICDLRADGVGSRRVLEALQTSLAWTGKWSICGSSQGYNPSMAVRACGAQAPKVDVFQMILPLCESCAFKLHATAGLRVPNEPRRP